MHRLFHITGYYQCKLFNPFEPTLKGIELLSLKPGVYTAYTAYYYITILILQHMIHT